MEKMTGDVVEMSAMLRWMGVPVGERRATEGGRLTLGSGRGADIIVPEEVGAGAAFQLLECAGGICEVNVPTGWDVKLFHHDREETEIADKGRRTVLLGATRRCVMRNGPFEIEVAPVRPRPPMRQMIVKSLDRRFIGWMALAASLTVVTTAFALFVYREAQPVQGELVITGVTYFDRTTRAPVPPIKAVESAPKKTDSGRVKPAPTKIQRNDNARPFAPAGREFDLKKARGSGLVAAISGAGGPVKSIFNPGGIGASINNAIGGLVGPTYGSASGLEGLLPRGGPDGGGDGALPIGSIMGPAGGGRKGMDVALVDRAKDEVRVDGGRIVMDGGLDKEVVGRMIRMRLSQAKYCYEKALAKNPNLFGKVTVQFVIGAAGKVEEARISETMMNNAEVEECLVRKVMSWEFPVPRGGGQVYVTYPFVFANAGG